MRSAVYLGQRLDADPQSTQPPDCAIQIQLWGCYHDAQMTKSSTGNGII